MTKIDCVINVCGKPIQTALAIVSLMARSGHLIDKLYFIEENTAPHGHTFGPHDFILARYPETIIHFKPKKWFYVGAIPRKHWQDETARLSLRYQYAFEHSDKEFLFTTHNDCHYTDDILQHLLDHIGTDMAAGHIGLCWACPASLAKKCTSAMYWDYRPSFEELSELYANAPKDKLTAPITDFSKDLRLQPWPLPMCRVNEWAALINLRKARRVTMPAGSAAPFGAYCQSRSFIMDIGVAWFRDISQMGFRCKHVHIYNHVQHGTGHPAMQDNDLYRKHEEAAWLTLRNVYGIEYPV